MTLSRFVSTSRDAGGSRVVARRIYRGKTNKAGGPYRRPPGVLGTPVLQHRPPGVAHRTIC